MASTNREFDLIIFGATGFTGYFIVRELLVSIRDKPGEYRDLKWAVCGRNESKLLEVLKNVGNELDQDLTNVPKVIADVKDQKSITDMAERTKLVINAVGPYRFYGKPVAEACVNAGTHHIDISGEPQYIEDVQVDLYSRALEKGILVISTCGWDSIPCDIGVDFLKKNFDGKLHSVETFMRTKAGPDVSLSTMNVKL